MIIHMLAHMHVLFAFIYRMKIIIYEIFLRFFISTHIDLTTHYFKL